jgi:hypothetical protein
MYKETKILQECVTTLESNVDKLRHEQDKMTHNEHVGMDKHGQQMLTLTTEVVHLRETQIRQTKVGTVMETKVSNEQMRNVPRNIWRYSEGTENRDRPDTQHNGTYL